MKRILRSLVFLALFCCTALPAYAESSIIPEDGYDVRKVRWGMSLEEIKRSESGPMFGKPVRLVPHRSYTKVRYRDQIFGIWCDIDYWFTPENGLYNVIYHFVPQPEQMADNLYDTIRDTLAKKYENPDHSLEYEYPSIHTFADKRTVIRLSQFAKGPLEKVVLQYDSMSYWNILMENERRLAAEYKKERLQE